MKLIRIFSSMLLIVLGILGIGAFIVFAINEQPIREWIPALLVSLVILFIGGRDLFAYYSERMKKSRQ